MLHFVGKGLTTGAGFLMETAGDYEDGMGLDVREYKTRKSMNYVTVGLSFLVNL